MKSINYRVLRVVSVIVFGALFIASSVYAETIYLKDGTIIRGAVKSEDEKTILIEMGDTWKRVDKRNIESINRDTAPSEKQTQTNAQAPSAAETDNSGAGQTGTSVFLGYDRSYLSYKEFMNGDVLDEDTGWNNGVYIEVRHDDESTFFRFLFDYVATDSATYNGSLQNGTPITMSTEEKFLTFEGNVGFKSLNFNTATLSPYVGLGYRDWKRGMDKLPDYQEDYSWWYIVAGGNLAYRFNRLVIAADVALTYPLSPKMTTNVAGQVDEATFDLKPYLGFRIEVPVNYEVSQDKNTKIFVFGTPFYQTWKFGASDPVTLTQNGIPVGSALEPDSTTVMYGFRLGMGLNF